MKPENRATADLLIKHKFIHGAQNIQPLFKKELARIRSVMQSSVNIDNLMIENDKKQEQIAREKFLAEAEKR